ncbi:MAG: UDP-2,4-diacetamido-2,4,6-trideoxy-beta-L-altropyranose hydrolase [Alphaproteobacteria bacterium]|nr:UDP-2,4-diacetamido-2,4,6-trideoxy-beta-L-altropyranose hydrolase [Alphaproteobacteria bacterium]
MREALFRVDAAPQIGGGHVVRCLALASAMREVGWNCRFLVGTGSLRTVPALGAAGHVVHQGEAAWRQAPRSADLLVVDHYALAAEQERIWRGRVGAILVIDDLADRPHDCDWLLDQTYGRKASDYTGLVPSGSRLLLGPDYALLRPEFARCRAAALARRRGMTAVRRLLIAPGATDPSDLAATLLDAAETLTGVAIDVAIGGAAPHLGRLRARAARLPQVTVHVDAVDMAGLMSAADLCLGAAGSTSWERCCLGLPGLLAVVADNQEAVARGLAAAGAVEVVASDDAAALASALLRLATNPVRRQEMSASAAALCDGEGACRVAALLG